MNVSVIILAAGAGTRMKSQTPKVLHKICGKAMLFYSIDEALMVSDDVHIVLFHQETLIKENVLKAYKKVYDEGKLHFHTQDVAHFPGTGGALMQGSKDSKTPISHNPKQLFACKYDEILILNGDMPLVRAQTLKKLCAHTSPIVMSILHLANPNGYGRVVLKDNKVQKIIEQKDANEEELLIQDVNAGVYKINKDILQNYLFRLEDSNAQKEFYLTDVIFYATQDNVPISALKVCEEEFMGVNSKAQLAEAQEVMLHRLRTNAMEQGVIMHLPHTIYIESQVRFSGECIIEQGVQISGECEIKDSHIKAHSIIESSIIESSDIGPLAHIRPKSYIKATHIGNFVETKASVLNGVKAGHLSYLGDCEIDSGSNVGAGVITCNYDGKAKHKSIIGKNVFIGSDTQLIAPVSIASHTLIGAGSTITKDVQEGDLVLSRTPQKHIKNGYFKFFNIKE
ncbi:bifunctional UDP-N-acetylglucosamine diphosphorylase/glucosamine-1-phosphate N-acetyltransferase GlmU [Helicobacter japonicus]|uniref:Bifunctional protein GlmU n=1 Tax=Helicobacter japonicus TaxID=425400 RepID=A0A4U8TLR0_9HELI|nr:bifunctional UDP-N-acetylglucosamine diphosphorylase/glucosamine-1-phosphate N-acetyltransferase GlmU [Helicobacter japonicus]TLE01224.1 bifunctional UDP-N-acetylglucosamine diphosphorylase/glucosamine-1-phosphate N-acetyltransferase GlmU [Helicobacter japonicus]